MHRGRAIPAFRLHHVGYRLHRLIHGVTHALHGFAYSALSGFRRGEYSRTHHGADHQSGAHTAEIRTGMTHVSITPLLVQP